MIFTKWRRRRREQVRQAVLEALDRRGAVPLFDLMQETGMRAVRLSIALVELEDADEIRSFFGSPDPTSGLRRRYYQPAVRCTCCKRAVSVAEDGRCGHCYNVCRPGDPRRCGPDGFK